MSDHFYRVPVRGVTELPGPMINTQDHERQASHCKHTLSHLDIEPHQQLSKDMLSFNTTPADAAFPFSVIPTCCHRLTDLRSAIALCNRTTG